MPYGQEISQQSSGKEFFNSLSQKRKAFDEGALLPEDVQDSHNGLEVDGHASSADEDTNKPKRGKGKPVDRDRGIE